MRDPDTLDEISKERFEGTVLKAISRNMKIKQEPTEEQGPPKNGQMPVTQVEEGSPFSPENFHYFNIVCPSQVKIKVEKTKEDEKEEGAEEGEQMEIKVEKEEDDKPLPDASAGREAKPEPSTGRLVMTVDGQQKQLSFCPNDLLSTATMFDGDRVRVLSSEHRRLD